MAHAYFATDVAAARSGDTLDVTGDEARHAITVARVHQGEPLLLLDGNGARVAATVTEVLRDRFRAEATEDATVHTEPEPRILLVQALAKGGRDEQALQAAVELGISEVIPWQAERSVVKWGPKAPKQQARWQNIAREATKQSLRAHVPQVAEVATTAQLTKQLADTQALVLHPAATTPLSEAALPEAGTMALLVGPEGGVSDRELTQLTDAGATAVRLGENVLRTSTAGPAALALLLTRYRRW